MALRVGQPGRLRSSSRGLNADEQATDTAALIQSLAFQTSTSHIDEYRRLADTAEKLRRDLGSQAPSKDTFRHGGGFDRILNLFKEVDLRRDTPHNDEQYFATCIRLIKNLLALLATALDEHHGNERYFNNHLDGWSTLNHVFDDFQGRLVETTRSETVAQHLAALYDSLLAFALGIDDFAEFSKQPAFSDYQQLTPKNVTIKHPSSCADVLRLALQASTFTSATHTDATLGLSARVFQVLLEILQDSIRNTVDLWKTGVLSDALVIALGTKVPDSWTRCLDSLILAVGRYGLNDLDDTALLFRKANESESARTILLSLLQSSKEPAFFQFDLKLYGFSSIEFSSLSRGFPSAFGYTLSAWIRIDEFDTKAHTTLFGAFDASQKCFVLMYLEKDSHQLILQTSVRAPNPSVRYKSTRFEASRWYHVALTHRKNAADPAQSVASLFIDGQFAEQRRCIYPESPDDHGDAPNATSPPVNGSRRSRPVQAFFGTPRNVATAVTPNAVISRWSLGSAHLYAMPLSDEFVAVQHQLGPRYRGNFQDCLGPLLTYRASAELNRYNETLHPDKSDRSDIVTATEGRGSEVVPESRLLLSICPASVIDFTASAVHVAAVKYELDSKGLSKYQYLSQKASAVAVNTAIGTIGDAIASTRGAGIVTGDPVIVVPRPLDDASWGLGGSLPIFLQLLESANSKQAFLQAVKIAFDCVKDNWRTSEAMEKGHGFGVFAMIIREKLGFDTPSPQTSHRKPASTLNLEDRQTMPAELLALVLSFVGYDKNRPEFSLLVNPMAYRILLLDFDTWRRCNLETQKLYYTQFVHFVAGNRNSAFNLKRLVRMRVVKKLIEALKSEDISKDAAALLMASLKALLDGNSAQTLYRDLAMFVAFGLHDSRAMPITSMRSMASTVSLRQKVGAWPRSARGSRPSTPGGAPMQSQEPGLPRYELALLALRLLAEIINDDRTGSAVRRFNRAVPNRWLLHILAESDVRVVELALSIICRALTTLGPEFKTAFIDRNSGFVTLKSRLKPFWRSKIVWQLCFGIFFGRSIPSDWLSEDFTAFHLVEMLNINDRTAITNPEVLPTLFAMLEAGLRHVSKDDENDSPDAKVLKTVIQFLSELYDRSNAFREFAVSSRYLQDLLFVLFPLLTGSDRMAADTELQSEGLSFKGEEVKMRPHSNSLGERPQSVRSLQMETGKRTHSPMSANRVQAPHRISSFVLVNDDGNRLHVPPAQFNAPMAPKASAPLKISITNSLVESLLELAISLFIDQVCYKDKFSGIGLFLKVPPGFREHQAYFESYLLVNALSQLGSHLRLNQRLLVETRVLTNLARYCQHMAEAVSEGWFIDGAQPLLDFTGEILEHLQQPEISSVKSVRLCSQSTNAIRVVFLKATLWRLAELDEDANEQHVGDFLNKMTYWQTILFAAENQETLFTKLICYLLYHKLVSGVKSVRLAAARLWRMVLVQKPTETATMLTNTMGPDQRHLSTGFMKLVSMDDDDFLTWVDQNKATLDAVFHNSLSKPWDDFVSIENRSAEETNKNRLNKRREKLRQWHLEESTADDFIHKYEVSTSHWRANVHSQERVKLQRGLQDHQESVSQLYTAFSSMEKVLHQPCGLSSSSLPPKWRLDETEAVNRMRMRIIPDTSHLKDSFQPKRKASTRAPNGLAVNTQIPRIVSDEPTPTMTPTPITPLQATMDGSGEATEQQRSRSDSVSNSQLLEGGFEIVDDPREDEDGLIEDKNRKVMTSLQHGDMVQGLYNTSRIVGLEACEGLIVIGQKCLYMQDNFFQRSDGEIVSVSQAPEDERDPYVQLISGKDVGSTRTRHSIGDQEARHWTWAEVLSVSKRRFLLRDVAIEVFFTDGRSYLLTCMSSKVRDDLYSSIVSRAPHVHSTSAVANEDAWRLDTLRNPEDAPKNLGSKFGSLFNSGPANTATKRWQRGEMSNFQYLMLINTMAGRTFNDLTQYPVFPWVLADYSSDELDLEDPKSFRDFSKPMGCQTPAREAEYKDRYQQFAEMGDGTSPAFHYGTHYSSAMIVSSFLIRLQPFVQSYLLLQGGSFDHADRLFDSMEKAWLSASRDTMSDVRELTPEFFYLPEFLININKYDFGAKQVSGALVDDVHLPKWAKGDPQIFIAKHREALESRYVSEHLHDWIDLVFGFKQRGEAAIEATNMFQHLSYGGAKDLDKIDDQVERLATIGIIHSFGQTPHQVFSKAHSYRELDKQAEQKLDTLAETLTRLPDTLLRIGEKVADLTFSPTQTRLLASGPYRLNMLPDCDRFVQWGFADNSIRFFSNHTKRLLGLYENTHVGPITTATFGDSKTLITAGQDCTIGVWKVIATKNLIEIQSKAYLFGHRTPVTVLAASRVFSTLVSASEDGQVLVWGLNRHDCIRVLLPAGDPTIQAARISNVSGHILLCRGPYALLYTLNGQLLVKQNLCERDGIESEILCCTFYEGVGSEFLERELIFTGHKHGVTNVWTLTCLGDGSWTLLLIKRMTPGGGSGSVVGVTSVLPVGKSVYTGDEEGSVWSWECVVRGGSGSGLAYRAR